jgi:uncharacterized membrane protein YdbT with pleckstrin-like domain
VKLMHVSAPSRRPGVPRSLYRGLAWAAAIELVAGAIAVLLFVFGLPWFGGALGAAFGIPVQ